MPRDRTMGGTVTATQALALRGGLWIAAAFVVLVCVVTTISIWWAAIAVLTYMASDGYLRAEYKGSSR